MGGGESIKFDVFFDYQCPFVYRAAGLIDAVRRSGDRNLEVRWRYFSLTQVNSKDDGWTVWDAPASEPVRGRLAFQAAEAARRQGRFDEMHGALLQARHRDHRGGVAEHGVFGTPTFVFAGGAGAYVRLAESARENGAVEVFDRLFTVAAAEPSILEIKRPYRR